VSSYHYICKIWWDFKVSRLDFVADTGERYEVGINVGPTGRGDVIALGGMLTMEVMRCNAVLLYIPWLWARKYRLCCTAFKKDESHGSFSETFEPLVSKAIRRLKMYCIAEFKRWVRRCIDIRVLQPCLG
jgi:hypothetical protein